MYNSLCRIVLLCVLAAHLAQGCAPNRAGSGAAAPSSPAAQAPQDRAKASDLPFGVRMSLADLLRTRLGPLAVTPDSLYAPPPEGFSGSYLVKVSLERPQVFLLGNVSEYRDGPGGLAVGQEDGAIRIFGRGGAGDWPCPSVLLEDGRPASAIGYAPTSPLLAASGRDGKKVEVFDLRQCGSTHSHDLKSIVRKLAVSPTGTFVAAVDDVHRLWFGPAAGEMKSIATLRFETLDLTFTPQGGVLMVADEAGWVTLWSTKDGRRMDQFRVDGGPFESARFRGRHIHFMPAQGQPLAWDVVSRAKDDGAGEGPYVLRDGSLSYTPEEPLWVRKVLFGQADLSVDVSRAARQIRLRDLDGGERRYSLETGLPLGQADAGAAGWSPVAGSLDASGAFVVDGERFQAAQPIRAGQGGVLMCRSVSEREFFLWWLPADAPGTSASDGAESGRLPFRPSLKASGQVRWVTLPGQAGAP